MLRSCLIVVFSLISQIAISDSYAPYRAICQLGVASGQGSGTLIARRPTGEGLILSCRHVAIGPGRPVTVKWPGFISSGRVLTVTPGSGFDTDQSLIVCSQTPPGIKPIKVSRYRNLPQYSWVASGYRSNVLYATRFLAASRQYQNGIIEIPAPLIKGMSGGPLFNNKRELVGVIVASDFKSIGICSDGERLHTMIQQFLVSPSTP